MSISRRQFIARAGAATAGLIVPSFAARALAHVATFGEPLLEFSPETECVWHALPVDDGDCHFVLIDTSVPFSVPHMTWCQFLEIRGDPVETWFEEWDLTPGQLDDLADPVYTQIYWESAGGPLARVFDRLEDLEPQLGPQLTTRGSELGYVAFEDAPCPGTWGRWVDVSCDAGLSCLQHRLNELRTGIRIEIAPDGLY
ncbi:MAG: hypothetical protein V3R16_08905 [Nitrospirales bacterium]